MIEPNTNRGGNSDRDTGDDFKIEGSGLDASLFRGKAQPEKSRGEILGTVRFDNHGAIDEHAYIRLSEGSS